MQIQCINGQSFGALQCHPNYSEVEYILATKLSWGNFNKDRINFILNEADKYLDKLAKNKTHADIYIGGDLTKNPKICAEIGGKLIKENFFNGPISILKKALKISNKLETQK